MKTYNANQLLDKVNAFMKQMPYARPPKGLYEPIAYELSLGGKRVRPVLMLMAYNLYKEDVDTILSQAVGLETYHNHTLLHDDVMDQADMRRGKPTVHNVWNENTAILSGDAMLILAYRLMADCDKEKLADVLHTFTETTMEICEGQQWDMEFETRMDVKVEEYIEMIRLKTSVLLANALQIGAYIAGANDKEQEALYQFGIHVGLAFQIQDDILDVWGDPKTFGKAVGGDIACNKKTFVYLEAMRRVGDEAKGERLEAKGERREAREELEDWYGQVLDDNKEKIARVKEIFEQLGVKEACEQVVRDYTQKALDILETLPQNAATEELRQLAEKLLVRSV
mgnify:CR=1 FL=1